MNNDNRFGLGEPVYTPRAFNGPFYVMNAADTGAVSAPTDQDPAAAFMKALCKSIEEQTYKACNQVGDAVNDAVKVGLGLVGDLLSDNVCDKKQDRAGKALNSCVERIVGSQLGYMGAEAQNLSFRLCEALAKSNKRTLELNWHYAGYVENGVAPNGIGNAFETKMKRGERVRGLKDRYSNFPDSNEVGPCALKNVIRSCLKSVLLLEETLTRIPNLADRRLIMLGWLLRWIPGKFDIKTEKGTRGVCRGIDFLVRDALKSPKMQEFLLDPTLSAITAATDGELQASDTNKPNKPNKPTQPGSTPPRAVSKTDPELAKARLEATKSALLKAKAEADRKKGLQPTKKQTKSGAGGIAALAAAGIGAYFMLKV